MAKVVTIAAAESATTKVVNAADTSWVFDADGSTVGGQTGAYVEGPAPAPLGVGSAELGVTAANEGEILATSILAGTPLADLTELAYSSFQPAGTTAVSLQFSVRYNPGDTGWQGRLVYEPTYTAGVLPSGWSRWDTLDGKWWASNGAGAGCLQATPCTWSQILAKWPQIQINPTAAQVLFKVGSGLSTPFTGNVDRLTIGANDSLGNITTTTYDFEPTVIPPTPPTPPITPTPTLPDFNPVTPTRVFDTRPGTPVALRSVAQVRVGPSSPLEVKLTDLPGGLVPASGVGAVSLNVTSTGSLARGFVTVTPCGPVGEASSVNFQAGVDTANAVLTPVSASGSVCFTSDVPTYLVVDVNGWFKSPSGFTPVTPTRVFDTRPGTPVALRSVAQVRVGPSSPLEVKLTDLPGGLVPASGVGAVSLNVTSTGSLARGFVTVTPCGPVGEASSVNFQAGVDTANAVLTPVSSSGSVCFTSDVPTYLVVDVNGWFKSPSGFTPVTPTRVFDTRPGTPVALRSVAQVRVGPSSPLEVKLTDLPGGLVPASGVGAVSLNVTSTGSLARGFVTVTPCGPVGEASSVNFQAGVDTANAVLTPVSSSGSVCFTSDVPTYLVVDVNGWFSDTGT